MASKPGLPAPVAGTQLAVNEVKGNITELEKTGLRDNLEYEYTAGVLKNIKFHLKKAEEMEEEEKRPHLTGAAEVRKKWEPIKSAWSDAEKRAKALLAKFDEDQRRSAAAEQLRLNAEAAKKRERLEKQAAKASSQGRHEQAALIADAAASVVAPVLQVEKPKVAGVHTRTVWHYEVTDETKVDAAYKSIDHKKLAKIVQTLKENAKMLSGIRVWSTTEISSESEEPAP
jgi:hypothetical protein